MNNYDQWKTGGDMPGFEEGPVVDAQDETEAETYVQSLKHALEDWVSAVENHASPHVAAELLRLADAKLSGARDRMIGKAKAALSARTPSLQGTSRRAKNAARTSPKSPKTRSKGRRGAKTKGVNRDAA